MTDGPGTSGEFLTLLGALREGIATDDDFARLDHLLASDVALQQEYVEYMLLCAELRRYHGMPEAEDAELGSGQWASEMLLVDGSVDENLSETEIILDEVVEADRRCAKKQAADRARREAELHRDAVRRAAEEALERFREQERQRQEELAYREHLARRRQLAVSVLTVVVLLVSTVLVWVSRWQGRSRSATTPPEAVLPPVVARIVRSSNAQWSQPAFSTRRGAQLTTSRMSLKRGFVELAFDGGARVIMQAPTTVQLESPDQVFLSGGAVSVTVADGSTGFVVRTPTGTVVDYGTEFGVLVNKKGETEALVYKGKVGLRSGSDPIRSVMSLMLTAGQAGAVDTAGGVKQKVFRPGKVVRKMPRSSNFGIPGQRFDLADVLGGGNGFGTGRRGAAISPVTGQEVRLKETDRHGPHQYTQIPWHRYIDGTFVPDGEHSQTVSSQGHLFAECPATNNIYYLESTNVGRADCGLQWLDGQAYGLENRPCILMHANLGITFDLREIASANPGVRIVRFSSGFGVSERATDRPCNADFWVLVDGEVRFHRRGLTTKGLAGTIDVELDAADRFLTLITTDGGDPDRPKLRGTDSDWCVFAEPILELAPVAEAAVADGQDEKASPAGSYN